VSLPELRTHGQNLTNTAVKWRYSARRTQLWFYVCVSICTSLYESVLVETTACQNWRVFIESLYRNTSKRRRRRDLLDVVIGEVAAALEIRLTHRYERAIDFWRPWHKHLRLKQVSLTPFSQMLNDPDEIWQASGLLGIHAT